MKNKDSKLVVIIGRSQCGKSTLIDEFSNRGYNIVDETATPVIKIRRDVKTLKDLKEKESIIYDLQLLKENYCQGLTFLDRSLIDTFAYGNFLKTLPSHFDKNLCFNRYHKVFALEDLPFKKDDIRIESDEVEAQKIYDIVENSYKKFGYNPVFVPKFSNKKQESIERRVEFILENL